MSIDPELVFQHLSRVNEETAEHFSAEDIADALDSNPDEVTEALESLSRAGRAYAVSTWGTYSHPRPAEKPPKAWSDLLEALAILAKHQSNDISPFNCDHDLLAVMADPGKFTSRELARLYELGFVPSEDDDEAAFYSFRYGSA